MSKFALLNLPEEVIFDLVSQTSEIWFKVTYAVPSLGSAWCIDAEIVRHIQAKIGIDPRDVRIIVIQTDALPSVAIVTLLKAENDLVDAITVIALRSHIRPLDLYNPDFDGDDYNPYVDRSDW